MIYDVIWMNIFDKTRTGEYGAGKTVNGFECLAKSIKESSDTFLFIITKGQMSIFENWLEEYSMKEHITFQMPDFVTNPVHEDVGRNLKLFVLKGFKE